MLNQLEKWLEMVGGRSMKKINKYIRHCYDAEDGSALLVVLGVIILLFVIVIGIFFFALDTQKKIALADRYTTLKDAKSYALEESKTRVSNYFDKEIRKIINEVGNPSDNNLVIAKVNEKIKTLCIIATSGEIDRSFFSSEQFGANKQYQFKVGVAPNALVEAGQVYSNAETGGWSASPSANSLQFAKRITIPIVVELQEKKDATSIKHSASSHLVYEVQWEEKTTTRPINNAAEIEKLDTWRNIFYNHYTNGENGLISADTWTRLLYRGYKYQAKNQKTFDGTAYNTVPLGQNFVFGGLKRKSLTDTKLTAASTAIPAISPAEPDNKTLTKNLLAKGSFIIQDIGLVGNLPDTLVSADNILAITGSRRLDETRFKDIYGKANTGVFISRLNQKTTFQHSKIHMPSLLITQTRKSIKSLDTGLLLDNSEIKTNAAPDKFDYSDYLKSVGLENPQQHPRWKDLLTGGLVIAGSTVELKNDATIELGANSNFILTNAAIKEDAKGEESFSYQMTHTNPGRPDATIPNPPSVLKIGDYSRVTQGSTDVSFIDAPKKNRRASSSENGTQAQDDWLDVSVARNTIDIGASGELNLGITGIEPFNLKVAKDGIFSFYAPSDPSLLDPTFLKEGTIKGKVIIYVWHNDFDVRAHLLGAGIKTKVKTKIEDANNGEVTLINAIGTQSGSRNVLRTFSYMVDVDFKKKK